MSDEEKPKRKISNAELDNVKNYLVVELAYDLTVCLPYKEGIALLGCLENAEKVSMNSYGDRQVTFKPATMTISSTILSQQAYRDSKMKMLLGVDDD